MTWLWILGIIVLLLLLLCLTRVGAAVRFGGGDLLLDVRFGLFRIHVLPAKKKPKTPEQEEAEARKAAAEAEKKKARADAKKAAKEAQKQARKGESFSVKTERVKDLLADAESAVNALWPPLKRALNRTRKGIRIHPLQLSLTIGGQADPAAAAQLYGCLHAAVWTAMPALEQVLDIPDPYIHIGMDFECADTVIEGECGVTLRIGTLLAVGVSTAIPTLKWFLQWKKKRKQTEKSPAAGEMNRKG